MLYKEIRLLADKAEVTFYETEEVRHNLEQRVTGLEGELQTVQEEWKQEYADLAEASANELNSEREKHKQAAHLKISKLQDELNASNATHARVYAELEVKHAEELAAEKVKIEKLAAEVASLQEELIAVDPLGHACRRQVAEEEAEVLASRKEAEAAEAAQLPIPPQTASTPPAPPSSWPGHDGSSTCFRGLFAEPKSAEAPGARIARYMMSDDEADCSISVHTAAVPKTLQQGRSPSETIPEEPAQSTQEPQEPPIQEQQGAAGPLSPIEDETDLQVAAEPLMAEEDGAETAGSWSMCGTENSWLKIPEFHEHPELYMYKSLKAEEARGIPHCFRLSWEPSIFKHPSLELVCSNPSRTCFLNCSTGICRHGATHQLVETHVRIQEMVTTKRLRSKHI